MRLSDPTRNVINQVVVFASRFVSDLVILFAVTKFLGVDKLGVYAFAMTFGLMARLVLDMGIGIYLVRAVSVEKHLVSKYVNGALSLLLLFSPLVLIISYLLLANTSFADGKLTGVLIVLLGFIVVTFSSVFNSVFLAFSQLKFQAISTFTQELSYALVGFILLSNEFSIESLLIWYSITRCFSLLISAYYYDLHIEKIRFDFDGEMLKKIIVESLPYMGNFVLTAIYARGITLVISHYHGDSVTGYFEIAFQFSLRFIIVMQIISRGFFPKLSELHGSKELGLYLKIAKSLILAADLIAVFLILGVIVFKNALLSEYFNIENPTVSASIDIMLVALFFKVFNSVLADFLTTSMNQKLRTRSIGLGVFVCVICYFTLIPNYGLIGAAVTTAIVELMILIALVFFTGPSIRRYVLWLMFRAFLTLFALHWSYIHFLHRSIFMSIILVVYLYVVYKRDLSNFQGLRKILHED